MIVCNGTCALRCKTAPMKRMALLKNAELKSDRRQGTQNSPDVYGTANRGRKLVSENRSNEA